MNTLDLVSKRVQLRKASTTNGGEWQGPCPGCGGTDRFHVWPAQYEGKGGYWCRGCGKTGDNIQFLREFEGLSFREACARLNMSLPQRPEARRPVVSHHQPVEFVPTAHIPPADLWQEKAEKFLSWSQANLTEKPEVLTWLAARGISRDTAVEFRLGLNIGEDGKDIYRPRKAWGLPEALKDDGRPKVLWIPRGLVIPYVVEGVIHRIRIRRPEGDPRYYVLPGSSTAIMVIGRERRAFVIVEAELDAIAVAASNTFLAGAVAMGSSHAKPDAEAFAILKGALQILNALDYDTAGRSASHWWAENFDRCDRWPVPRGKDPGDAHRLGIDLAKWIEAGLPPALTISAKEGKPEQKGRGDAPGPAPSAAASPIAPSVEAPPFLAELYSLLRRNPMVRIINTPDRFTVLRGKGKYVGGRINALVFRTPAVRDYLMNHPAEEIDGNNLINQGG
jgi:hypothetical protein